MTTLGESMWSSAKFYFNLLRLSLLYQFKEFFRHSTLHGVRYIVEPGRPFFEKFMWFIFTATGTISALVIIASLWEKFQTNPTITGLDTNFQTIKLAFPTVLVCPEEPFDDGAVVDVAFNRLSGQDSDLSVEFEEFLRKLTLLSFDTLKEFHAMAANLTAPPVKQNIRDLLFQTVTKCENVFHYCNFREDNLNCCDAFKPLLTERGYCYAFNPKYVDDGQHNLGKNTNIFELSETDKKWSLVVYPKLTSKIYVHSQLEMSSLEMTNQPIAWNTDHSVDILITMKETVTTPDTKQLSIG